MTINSVFERGKDGHYTKRALLYQDIVHYSLIRSKKNLDKNELQFKHRELAKWVLGRNLELINRYKEPSTRHTTLSNRIEDTQNRIKNRLEDLIRMKLIAKVGLIKQEKGTGSVTLYAFRPYVYFIAYILEFIRPENKSDSSTEILTLIRSFAEVNESHIMDFVYRYFKKCNENGVFDKVINYFVEVILLKTQIYTGRDLIKTFLGFTHVSNWILPYPDIFIKTLEESDEVGKKIILFRIKTDIEEYYYQHYLEDEIDILEINMNVITNLKKINGERDQANFVSVTGKEWENIRLNNVGDILQIAVPAFCNNCKSDRAFLVDVFSYLDSYRRRPVYEPDSSGIGGKCTRCDGYIVGGLIRFPYFNISAPWIESDFSRFI